MQFIENWETLLYKVINLEGIDPWQIDIVELADKYLEYIEKEGIDFRVSGKVILAAAILLRMKAEILATEEEEPEPIIDYSLYEIPGIEPLTKKVPKRKPTFDELVNALKSALRIKKKRSRRPKPRTEDIVLERDFVERIEALYEELKKLAQKFNQIKFSNLVKRKSRKGIIGKFLPLLHLAQDRKVSLNQEKLFGEIYIRLMG